MIHRVPPAPSVSKIHALEPNEPRFKFFGVASGGCGHLRYDSRMDLLAAADATAAPQLRNRTDIPDRFKWNLTRIFPTWEAWKAAYDELDRQIVAYAALQGSLGGAADALLAAYRVRDDIGALSYKVWYFPALQYDQDQRDTSCRQ